jgi:hypothetical protein
LDDSATLIRLARGHVVARCRIAEPAMRLGTDDAPTVGQPTAPSAWTMIPCPNCRADTVTRTLPVNGAAVPLDVEACSACRLLWFDRGTSVRLTPAAVIELFRYIGSVAGADRSPPLESNFDCPRCSLALAFTHDMQRATRFTYWRCEWGHGQLITFHQFLREKDFIRMPTGAEIARLRATVRQVSCSQCGAPIDLEHDSACAHCGAPIALVDPDGVAKALQALTAGSATRTADPAAVRAALAAAPILAAAAFEAEQERARTRWRAQETNSGAGCDLVGIGVSALADWLATRLTV